MADDYSNLAAAAIGSSFNLASSGLASASSEKIAKKQMAWQAEQNNLDRQFNASQAQLSRNYATEMMDKQYRQNSISSQIAQYKAAGVNPALAYSSGSSFVGGSLPSSSSASHNGSYSLPNQKPLDFSGAVSDAVNLAQLNLIKAQARNLDADSNKKSAETEGITTENSFKSDLLKGQIELQNVNIRVGLSQESLNKSQSDLNYETCKQLDETTKNIITTRDLLFKQIENIDADTRGKLIDNFFKSDMYKAQLKKMAAEIHLSYTQANDIVKSFAFRAAEAYSVADLNKAYAASYNCLLDNGYYEAQASNEWAKNSNLKAENRILNFQGDKLDFDLNPLRTYYGSQGKSGLGNKTDAAIVNQLDVLGIWLNKLAPGLFLAK